MFINKYMNLDIQSNKNVRTKMKKVCENPCGHILEIFYIGYSFKDLEYLYGSKKSK